MVEFINGGFEDGPNPSGFQVINSGGDAALWIPGWTLVSGEVDLLNTPQGKAVDLNGFSVNTIAQTLDTSANVGDTVRFSITVQDNPSTSAATGFTLRINGQPVLPEDTSAAQSANATSGLVMLRDAQPPVTFTFSFTATGSDSVSITGYADWGTRGTYLGGVEVVEVIEVVCLAVGTLVATDRGEVPAGSLGVGDRVLTADHGFQPVRWTGRQCVAGATLRARPKLRPVRIAAGALGAGLPRRDLWVSRQHRMLIRSPIVARVCDVPEVLVPAIRLTGLPGIAIDDSCEALDYVHLAFDRHEVILAEGAPTESLLLGPRACGILGTTTMLAIGHLQSAPARPIPPGRVQRQLIARHLRNGKPVLEPGAEDLSRAS